MTLQKAINFFESLINETTNKSETKVYKKFLHILSELKNREFSKDEMQSIEKELDILHLESDPKNRKKYFNKALSKFEKYLKDIFSLTPKGYYTNMGIGLGSTFGLLFGVVFLSSFERSTGIALGLSIGMLIGVIIGQSLETKAISKGNVI